MRPPFFIFYAFNAGLFLVFMPSNSKSPSHFSDIYCSVIKAQGLNLQRNGTPEPLKMIYPKDESKVSVCCHLIFREVTAELRVLAKQKSDLVPFISVQKSEKCVFGGLENMSSPPKSYCILNISWSRCVESQFLMNACWTSAALQLQSQEEFVWEKKNKCFSLFSAFFCAGDDLVTERL